MEHTTPLDREILTHYWTRAGEFPGIGHSSQSETIERFLRLGLLIRLDEPNKYGAMLEANREALKAYMEALAAVPLPVQRWVVPE